MSKWDELSMAEKAEMMKVAVRQGITNLSDIKQRYNEFAEGGSKVEEEEGITDEEYLNTMEKVAEENYKNWGYNNSDEALVHALNDNTYDYRGYYNKYPQSRANADTHWTDEFKTVYHPTFSNESIYSSKKSQYNPYGLPGGFWIGEDENASFIPMAWQAINNQYKSGGGIHIKPSHRGRLTELKKRTGKTEAELYNDGNPAHKKMVVFARNARKWKHAFGGNLFDGGGNTQASDYKYIQNEDGQWSRITNDDMGRAFQGLTVTPNRTKIKYVPERIDNSKQGIKQRENFFLYRDNEGNLRGEPGLEITSPEFEILGAAPLIKGAGKIVEKVIYNKINPLGEPVIPENYLTLKPRVIPSNNRTIIKESPFLRWGNDERFAVQPSKETYDNIVAQLKEAKDYKSSSGYKNLVNRFTQESKAKGLNFNENLFDDGNSSLSKLTVSNREAGHLGEYYPTTNSIDLDLSQIGDMPVPFHEGIHWQRVGSPADRIGPKFEKWLEARKAKAPNEMQLFEEFRNSPEYERYYQRRAADKAIQDKVNDALYPFADETLRSKGELQAYGLEAGKAIGIEPFSEYPGMPDALTAIEKARKYSSQLRDVKAGGEENVRRFWDILTGNYIPSVTVGTLGLKSYLNK